MFRWVIKLVEFSTISSKISKDFKNLSKKNISRGLLNFFHWSRDEVEMWLFKGNYEIIKKEDVNEKVFQEEEGSEESSKDSKWIYDMEEDVIDLGSSNPVKTNKKGVFISDSSKTLNERDNEHYRDARDFSDKFHIVKHWLSSQRNPNPEEKLGWAVPCSVQVGFS